MPAGRRDAGFQRHTEELLVEKTGLVVGQCLADAELARNLFVVPDRRERRWHAHFLERGLRRGVGFCELRHL